MVSKVESDVDRGARQLLEQRTFGVLITNAESLPGYPFGSLTPYALDAQGRPVFLLSSLAIHSANLHADARAALFVFSDAAETKASVAARLNVIGQVRPVDAAEIDEMRALYVAAHPEAAQWAEFGDFSFYRMQPEQMYYVGGFGVMGWVSA